MYKLITNLNQLDLERFLAENPTYPVSNFNFSKFFDYNNCFHLKSVIDKIYYISDDYKDIKELTIELEQINYEDFTEGNEQEAIFVYVPEIAELKYFIKKVNVDILV